MNIPGLKNWIYTLWNIDNSIVRKHTGRALNVLKRSFPRQFTCNRDEWLDDSSTTLDCDLLVGPLRFSILDFIMINFLPLILLLLQFIIVSAIVYEKANRLRLITKMMGLSPMVYWFTNYVFYFTLYCVIITLLFVFGSWANVQAFVIHDTGIVFLFLFLWGHLLVISSFLMSVFFSSPRTATVVALLILILAPTVGDSIFYQLFNSDDTPQTAFIPFMFFPPWIMLRIVYWICLAGAFRQEINSDNWTTMGDGALLDCVGWMIGWWFFCVFALWYCEQVVVVGYVFFFVLFRSNTYLNVPNTHQSKTQIRYCKGTSVFHSQTVLGWCMEKLVRRQIGRECIESWFWNLKCDEKSQQRWKFDARRCEEWMWSSFRQIYRWFCSCTWSSQGLSTTIKRHAAQGRCEIVQFGSQEIWVHHTPGSQRCR